MHWKPNSLILIGVLLAAFTTAGVAQIATTQVADTIYHADGTAACGTVLISWPAFTTSYGDSIPGGSTSAAISTGGALSVQLIPNAGATPIGSYYTAVYHLDDGTVSRQYWVVSASLAPVKISGIESTVLPTSVAMQTVSKAYVDTAIAVATTGHPLDSSPFTLKAGDAMTGPLTLSADPVSATQAADKNYVDESVAALADGQEQMVYLGGDVGGTNSTPLVTGIQGQPVSNTSPSIGQTLNWNGTTYIPTTPPDTNLSTPTAIGNVTGAPSIALSANNAPAVTILGAPGGGSQYTAYYPSVFTHTQYQLPGDSTSNPGGDFPGGGIGFWYFNSYSPGCNYGPTDITSNAGWCLPVTMQLNLNSYTSGINGNLNLTSNFVADGDFTEINENVLERSARITPADEGTYVGIHNQTSESGEMAATVVTGGSGATVLTLNPTAYPTQAGPGSPLVDLDTAVTGTAVWASANSDGTANITTSFTVTAGTGGTLAANVDVPRLAPNTTGKLSSRLVTLSLNTSTPLTVGELCDVRGPARNEVFSLVTAPAPVGGVQTVTAWMAFSHTTGTPYQCGGAVGNYLAMTDYEPAASGPGLHSTQIYYEQVYGSTGPNTLIVGDRTAGSFESLFPTTGTVNVSMVQGADVMGVFDPATTTITIAAGSTTGTVGSCAELTGHWVNIPGAGDASYPVSSCSGTTIGLGTAAKNSVTAATLSHIPDGTYLAIMPPPSTAFGAGHHVINANNISALVSFTAFNSFFDNPWMWRFGDMDVPAGMGGGLRPDLNVRHTYGNNQDDTNYQGAGGKYYAPAWATLSGPVRNMITSEYWPLDSAAASSVGNGMPNCGGTLLCIGLGFSPRATATRGVIFRAGNTGTDLQYNPANQTFSIYFSGRDQLTLGPQLVTAGYDGATMVMHGGGPASSNYGSVEAGGNSGAGAYGVYAFGTNATAGLWVDYVAGSHTGGVGVGYSRGSLIPHQLAVAGDSGFGCNNATESTCAATVDASGNASFPTYTGPATAPSGSCPTNGVWVFSQDGHATFCAAGTWTTKI